MTLKTAIKPRMNTDEHGWKTLFRAADLRPTGEAIKLRFYPCSSVFIRGFSFSTAKIATPSPSCQLTTGGYLNLNAPVRIAWLILLCAGLALGCKSTRTASPDDLGSVTESVRRAAMNKETATPAAQAIGKIALVNTPLRYVILDFGTTRLPRSGTRFAIYRASEKVGQIRTSSEASGTNVAADIILGELQVGDEVRAE